jgi:alanyl-tRNA synthetase
MILDHSRIILYIFYEGTLPSNVGGGGNVMDIL